MDSCALNMKFACAELCKGFPALDCKSNLFKYNYDCYYYYYYYFFFSVLLFYSALGQFMMVFVSPLGFLLWNHGGCRESGTDVGL